MSSYYHFTLLISQNGHAHLIRVPLEIISFLTHLEVLGFQIVTCCCFIARPEKVFLYSCLFMYSDTAFRVIIFATLLDARCNKQQKWGSRACPAQLARNELEMVPDIHGMYCIHSMYYINSMYYTHSMYYIHSMYYTHRMYHVDSMYHIHSLNMPLQGIRNLCISITLLLCDIIFRLSI